jgi:integral membrane protein (TIGR01906 family)
MPPTRNVEKPKVTAPPVVERLGAPRGRRPSRRPSALAVAASAAVLLGQGAWARLRRQHWLGGAAAVLFAVALPVALVGTNVRLLFTTPPLYDFALREYDLPAVTGVPCLELERAMAEIRDYFTNDQSLLRITVTDEEGRANPLFTPREVIHMRDVKRLVAAIFTAQVLAFLYIGVYAVLRLVVERGRAWAGLARLARASVLGSLALALAFGVTALLGFDRLFTRFHELSFSNDLWQLDPDHHRLVQMFPQDFWLVSTVILAGLTVVELLALLALSWGYLRRVGRRGVGEVLPMQTRTPARGGPSPR